MTPWAPVGAKKDITLEGLEYIKLDGWTMVLSEDVYLEQSWPSDSKTKIYLNVNELHVACYQSLAIFNTNVEKTTIPSGSVLFAIKLKDIKKLVFDYDA